MADGDKCIGKLYLDISQVKNDIAEINEWLGKIGANINLEDRLSKGISQALTRLINEAKTAGAEMSKAMDTSGVSKKVTDAIRLYEKYFNAVGKMRDLEINGKDSTSSYIKLRAEAEKLFAKIQDLDAATRRQAEATREVAQAAQTYYAIQRADADKLIAKYDEAAAKKAAAEERAAAKAAAAHAKEEAAYNKMWQKAEAAANKAREAARKAEEDQANATEKEAVEAMIELLKQKADLETQAVKATAAGNIDNANLYLKEEETIRSLIQTLNELYADLFPNLEKEAAMNEEVRQAELRRQAAVNTARQKQEQINFKEQEDAVKNYANALVDYYNKLAEFNNNVASGKLIEGTERYNDAKDVVDRLGETAKNAGEKLRQMGVDANSAVDGMTNVQVAAAKVVDSEHNLASADTEGYLKRAKQLYIDLSDAIKNYNSEKQKGNELGMSTQQERINGLMNEVGILQEAVNKSNLEADAKQNILNIIQQCTTAENQHVAAIGQTAKGTGEIESQMTSLLTRMFSLMAVIRTIKGIISSTVEYVSQYYDKMNEIQIITQKSSEEVAKLGETYRDIADQMNVSSLDMADAAIYFTRQGLAAEEIEQRLKNVTMYAKTANVEFRDASEIITAVVNSMGLVEQEAEDGRNATQRVADVFLKIGDNAATSGQEIGEAMQKAAASAGAFGVSMEWLASYIAAVSETTRQEARTIGTAFNTIIARLHQIKQSGYNSEDETKVNDIAKALSKIDIVLMDQEGNWRDMEVILQEIAEKWGTLDGKTKSYIATTMAGVKQQNVFLALMNDMSKGIEGQSRAYELHELAINSAGTAQEKYATYMDSVTAAQDRLTIAQEKFYSLLNAGVIKGWYDMLTGIVNTITAGTRAFGGLNLILPITIGLVVTLIVTFNKLKLAAAEAGAASVASFMFNSHPIMMIISIVGLAITALTALASAFDNTSKQYEEASERLTESNQRLQKISAAQSSLAEMIDVLGDKTKLTNEDLNTYNSLLTTIGELSPTCKQAVENLTNGIGDQKDTTRELNEELERMLKNEQKLNAASLMEKYGAWTPESDESGQGTFWKAYQNWMPRWAEGKEGSEGFANMLRGAYNTATNVWDHRLILEKTLPRDVYDEIQKQFEALKDTDYDEDTKWGIIGDVIWQMFAGGGDTYSLADNLKNMALEAVDDVMSSIGPTLDATDAGILRQKLMNEIFGEDGEISSEEYNNMGKAIVKTISDFMLHGFEFDSDDAIRYVGKELFGEMFSMMFSEDEIIEAAQDADLGDAVSAAFAELIAAGFSNTQIAELLKNTDLADWDKMTDIMAEQIKDGLKKSFGVQTLGEFFEDLDTGEEIEDMLMWDDIDIATLKLIDDLTFAGTSLDDINQLMKDSESVDEFRTKLEELAKTLGEDLPEETEEGIKAIADLAKEIKASVSDIDKLDKAINALKEGEDIGLSDLLDLASAHPEILSVINDLDALQTKLEEIKQTEREDVWNQTQSMLLDNPDVMKNSQYAGFMTDDIQTLRQYMDTLNPASKEYYELSQYLELATANFLSASGSLDKINPDKIKEIQSELFYNSNADLNNRPVVTGDALAAAGWGDDAGDYGTVYTSQYWAGKEGIKWNQDVIVSITPILDNGEVLSPEELDKYMDELLAKSANMEELLVNDAKVNGGKGLLIDVTAVADDESFEEADKHVGDLMILLHKLQEMLYEPPEGSKKSWLQEQAEAAAEAANNEWAKSNGYVEQLTALQDEIDNNGVESALELWNSYSEAIRKSIADEYPELIQALSDVEEELKADSTTSEAATEAQERLNNALRKSKTYANPKHFTSTYDAIRKLEKGTISAAAAFDAWHSELDTVKKADEDIIDVTQKMADGTEVTASDVSNLSKVLNMSAEQIIADWPTAVSMFADLTGAGGELLDVFDALKEAAFIKITGTSEADFSQIKDGLISVQGLAEDVVNMLLATGEWSLEDVPLNTEAWVQGEDGSWNLEHLTGNMQVLRPSGNNPFQHGTGSGTSSSGSGRRRNGGGGGGSGSNSNEPSSDVTNLLDQMERIDKIHQYNMNYFNAQQQYYDTTGQLQGSIDAVRKEREELIAYQAVLESNIEAIQKMIAAKKKQLEATAQTDPAYQTLQNDLNSLNEALQQYTVDLYDNMTAQEEAAQAIEEYENKIRQMEIDIQNLIYQAILDREKKRKQMLAAEIEMENKVLDIIKQQYEEERDKILEATSARIEALQEERDLLSEQLQIRKEMEEKEEKAAKLAQLEAQYQRIVADPTRKKEAQKIKDQIDALRKEIAWDQAEDEVKAQQDSIDQQITSLEDYKQYIEEYYEDLFEHPQQLIAEMEMIMSMSSDKILQWLQENDNEYLNSSENMQLQMTESWEDTLLEMEGKHRDYWDEVYSIMEQGDDAIIQFLQENSEDYANAGRLQAEAYVDEWKKMLEELRKAQEQVVADLPPVTELYPTGGGSGGSGGGGGGGGGHTPTQTVKHGYSFRFNGNTYANEGYATKAKAKEAGIQRFKQLYEAEARNYTAHPYGYDLSGSIYNATLNSIVAYKKGGLASATGPAWLDGTPQDPERVLSPYQTKLFETMVQALENIDRISMPSMPNLGNIQTGNSSNVSVGDIIVNVDNLDTDSDYEELAEKVSDVLMERIGRTAVVGGLRINAT